MIEKPKRPKRLDIQDRQPPRTLQELTNRYDLDNTKIYDYLDELISKVNEKIKISDFIISITPSTARGNSGYGETILDISSLNANKILNIAFHSSSSFLLWGTTTDISNNPSSISIYGYRLAGTYTNAVSTKIRILYE